MTEQVYKGIKGKIKSSEETKKKISESIKKHWSIRKVGTHVE